MRFDLTLLRIPDDDTDSSQPSSARSYSSAGHDGLTDAESLTEWSDTADVRVLVCPPATPHCESESNKPPFGKAETHPKGKKRDDK